MSEDVVPYGADGGDLKTIATELAALTARVSDAEVTASPVAAAALSGARRHLLRASAAVEFAQEAKAWKDVADELIMKAQAEQENKHLEGD